LKVASVNVCGLLSKVICPEFLEFINKYDIVGLQETKIDEFDESTVEIPGYKFMHKCRKKYMLKSGGVGVYIKESLMNEVDVVDNSCDNCVMFYVKNIVDVNVNKVLFCVCYIEPENSNYFDPDCFDKMQVDICKYGNDIPLVLMGDFNGRTGNLNDQIQVDTEVMENCGFDEEMLEQIFGECGNVDGEQIQRTSADRVVNNSGYKVIELCKNNKLIILNGRMGDDAGHGKMTCKGASVVDYVILSQSLLNQVLEFDVLEFDNLLSDVHCPLYMSLKVQSHNKVMTESKKNGIASADNAVFVRPRWRREYGDLFVQGLNFDEINSCKTLLSSMLENKSFTTDSINKVNFEVCEVLRKSARNCGSIIHESECNNKTSESGGRKATQKPWYNKACEKKRRELYRARNIYKRNKTDENMLQKKSVGKEYKKELRKQYVAYKRDVVKKLRNLKSSDPKRYWTMLNDKGKQGNKVVDIHLDVLSKHFRELSYRSDVEDDNINLDNVNTTNNESLNTVFTKQEVMDAIKNLKQGKASGLDEVINEFIIHSASAMVDVYVLLFNVVLESGIIPDSWSIGVIKPLYKGKGDKNNVDNYRGITLLSCISKLFTACINSRINKFLDENGLLGEEQAGFRKGYSTVDHIFSLHAIIEIYKALNKKLYCAFVDFKKAYDGIHRSLLWKKLLSYQINGKVLNVIKNLYAHAKSCVCTKQCSTFFLSNIGLRQGENLSPILFALFLNDLQMHVSQVYNGLNELKDVILHNLSDDDVEVFVKLYILLYADDTVIMAESEKELQRALDGMYEYCVDNKLVVNANKTKIVIFARGKVRKYPIFLFGDDVIEVNDTYPYLGILFNYNGRFQKGEKKLYEQAQRAMFNVLSKCRKMFLPIDICVELFDQLVLPILLYGVEVWGPQSGYLADKLRLKFFKLLTKCRMSTPTNIILGELGRYPSEVYIRCRVLNYWYRLQVQMKEFSFASILYNVMCKLHMDGRYNFIWIEKVHTWMNELGFCDILRHQGVSLCWFKSAVKLRLQDQFKQKWFENIDNSESCINYRLFKCDWGLETYLKILPVHVAILMFKFRSGNCNLPVVKLRFEGINREERVCSLCKEDVGDEFHYIMSCKSLCSERAKYIKSYYRVNPNIIKFKSLMCSQSEDVLLNIFRFIKVITVKLSTAR